MGFSHSLDRKLVLVRTDQHVAWRGNALPGAWDGLMDALLGKAVANKTEEIRQRGSLS
jgi:hypothetical protein